MNASIYQQKAARTLNNTPIEQMSAQDIQIAFYALGLAGEAGEAVDAIKKGIVHRHGLDREKVRKELGDLCWYIASLCTLMDFDLGDILAENIAKLEVRYPNGFTTEDSKRRVDTVDPLDVTPDSW